MSTQHIKLNVPLSFNQVVDIVQQLSPKEKTKLKEILTKPQDGNECIIPEEHKNIVRQRIKTSQADPSRILKWDDVKHKIKL